MDLFDFQTIALDGTGPIIVVNDGLDAETFQDVKKFEQEYGEYISREQIEGIVDSEHAEGELHPAFIEFAIANGLGDAEDFYGEDTDDDLDEDEDEQDDDSDIELPPVLITRVFRLVLGNKSKLLMFVADPYFEMEDDDEGFDDDEEEDDFEE